jgi:hypothetical protein
VRWSLARGEHVMAARDASGQTAKVRVVVR